MQAVLECGVRGIACVGGHEECSDRKGMWVVLQPHPVPCTGCNTSACCQDCCEGCRDVWLNLRGTSRLQPTGRIGWHCVYS